MNAEERHKIILELLQASGQVSTADLSARFNVSEMTVRRDVVQLEKDGLLRRTHGGAARAAGSSFEPPFTLRSRLNVEEKKAIAYAVAQEIADGQTIVLDGGSTGKAVAEAILGRDLIVCALNMRVAEILLSSPNTRVMTPGGWVRHGELSVSGPPALRTLADHRFDTYVMTVSGVDTKAGLTEWNVDDAAVKRAALDSSGRCIVACDSSKFGQTAFSRVASLRDADLVLTDGGLTSEQLEALQDAGAELRVV
ncbi:DeoR/GlpR family DNA-binding transcription regulator [Amycolatopsis sp. NBC_01480]|uniref:DeoR/GlpR family DNA-binding transcription regulator n=1 Tax=Amycolatopsis sp. NBC_01480 TaxID=2903562 RepID=UPI002E2C86F8|nr:DeoR/GlpR family DNA-binding transcription regulator [Amycolatopsis sp. NBC_01480]